MFFLLSSSSEFCQQIFACPLSKMPVQMTGGWYMYNTIYMYNVQYTLNESDILQYNVSILHHKKRSKYNEAKNYPVPIFS